MFRTLIIMLGIVLFILIVFLILVPTFYWLYVVERPDAIPEVSYRAKIILTIIFFIPLLVCFTTIFVLFVKFLKRLGFKEYIFSIISITLVLIILASLFQRFVLSATPQYHRMEKFVLELLAQKDPPPP